MRKCGEQKALHEKTTKRTAQLEIAFFPIPAVSEIQLRERGREKENIEKEEIH